MGRLQEKAAIGELTILSNFGNIEHWKTIETQELFAEYVMPAFRELMLSACRFRVGAA